MSEFTLKKIGVVRSELKKIEDCPLQESEQAPEATIVLEEEFAEGQRDIRPGDKLVIVTWLHKADRNVLTTHRRNDTSKIFGVFSTRSPDRPNPLGLHTVTVQTVIDKRTFKVFSLEVLDGTPVVDIKVVI